jgi:hypothetical protein
MMVQPSVLTLISGHHPLAVKTARSSRYVPLKECGVIHTRRRFTPGRSKMKQAEYFPPVSITVLPELIRYGGPKFIPVYQIYAAQDNSWYKSEAQQFFIE